MQKLNNFNSLNTGRTKVVNIGNSYEKRIILGLEVRKTRRSSTFIDNKEV